MRLAPARPKVAEPLTGTTLTVPADSADGRCPWLDAPAEYLLPDALLHERAEEALDYVNLPRCIRGAELMPLAILAERTVDAMVG